MFAVPSTCSVEQKFSALKWMKYDWTDKDKQAIDRCVCSCPIRHKYSHPLHFCVKLLTQFLFVHLSWNPTWRLSSFSVVFFDNFRRQWLNASSSSCCRKFHKCSAHFHICKSFLKGLRYLGNTQATLWELGRSHDPAVTVVCAHQATP